MTHEAAEQRRKPGPKPRLLPHGVVTFTVRLPSDLVVRLDAVAASKPRPSRNAEIEEAVRRYLDG